MALPFSDMWKWICRQFDRIRKRSYDHGYGCDLCGAELFDYPVRRLCEACENSLPKTKNPCPRCGREGRSEGLCLDCKAKPPLYARGFSPFVYKAGAGLAVNRLKKGAPKLSAYFGERMAECFLQSGVCVEEEVLLAPVPMEKERLRERGYNQATFLAERIQICLEKAGVQASIREELYKARPTKLQKQMTGKERAENVKGAYRLRSRKPFVGKTVLLVDDVCTTGATGNECTKKLLAAGAKAVYFLTATAVPEPK